MTTACFPTVMIVSGGDFKVKTLIEDTLFDSI